MLMVEYQVLQEEYQVLKNNELFFNHFRLKYINKPGILKTNLSATTRIRRLR